MKSRDITIVIIVLIVIALVSGCFPEDSLEWSDDGSIGLLHEGGALYLIDGQSGDPTRIVEDNVQLWPTVSNDGKLIAYAAEVSCDSLPADLELLPSSQTLMIKECAELMKNNILRGDESRPGFPTIGHKAFESEYRNWIIRYMCENADDELTKKLGINKTQKGRTLPLECYRLLVKSTDSQNAQTVVATSVLPMMRPRFSPDKRRLAYLMQGMESGPEDPFDLYIASLEDNSRVMFVASSVAIGYDWREDSQAICYLRHDESIAGNMGLGVLGVADTTEPNALRAVPFGFSGSPIAFTFFSPWMRAEYGLGGRIFFSNAALSIPARKSDELKWSLFCYDPVTQSISDVLPRNLSDHVKEAIILFSLSPDKTEILIGLDDFVIYRLEDGQVLRPFKGISTGKSSSEDWVPAWKGNDQVSCMAPADSHYLNGTKEHGSEQIVIINTNAELIKVLSENWQLN